MLLHSAALVFGGLLPLVAGEAPSAAGPASRARLAELGCANCHAELAPAGVRTAPDLSLASRRLEFDWLLAHLESPRGADPESRMPELLGGLADAERRQARIELAAFLGSLAAPFPLDPVAEGADLARGARLYATVGCALCHGPRSLEDAGASMPGGADGGDGAPGATPGGAATRAPSSAGVATAPDASRLVALRDLRRKYQGPGLVDFLLRPLTHRPSGLMPDLHLSREEAGDLAAFLRGDTSDASGLLLEIDADAAASGRARFETLRCDACHVVPAATASGPQPGGARAAAKPAPRRSGDPRANPTGGCLADDVAPGIPDYRLADDERAQLRSAAQNIDAPLTPRDEIAVTLTAFRCTSCHVRDGVGAPNPALDAFFTTTEPELGDSARVPPTLDGVGGKLKREWLERLLADGGGTREAMTTRMPRFGWENVGGLGAHLAEVDARPPREYADPRGDERGELRDAGRALLGNRGLACITCHQWNGLEALAFQGPDLVGTYDRLQPAWFHDFLLDPEGFTPGIVMPASWPDGVAVHKGILDGDTERQLEALWFTLSLGTSAPEPDGLRRPDWRIEVEDEPVVYRGRSRVAGFRGIAVGFPEGLHYAFDAQNGALSALWSGDFVRVNWNGQGAGDFGPLGPATELPRDVALLEGDIAAKDWPLRPVMTEEAPVNPDPTYPRQHGYHFLGYQLDEGGVPTLRYSIGEVVVEDRSVPVERDGRVALERTLRLESESRTLLQLRLVDEARRASVLSERMKDGVRLTLLRPKEPAEDDGDPWPDPEASGLREGIATLELAPGITTFTIVYTFQAKESR